MSAGKEGARSIASLLRGGQVPRPGREGHPGLFVQSSLPAVTPSSQLCSPDSLGLGNSPEAVKTAPVQQWKLDLSPAVLLDPPERTFSSSNP